MKLEKKLEWRDISGRNIEIGDLIIYAALGGRSALLKFGMVTALKHRDARWRDDGEVPVIQAVTTDSWDGEKWEIQAKGRPVTLGELKRLIVVDDNQVSFQAYSVLRRAYEAAIKR